MSTTSGRVTLAFSCLGHAYMHLFTAFYFVIVLALEADWGESYSELIGLWTLGALMVGVGAIPAGWLADRWSAAGMMIVMFVGLGLAGIACAFLDTPMALLLGLTAIGLFSAIYHPVGIPWLVKSADQPGRALGINGVFGSVGIALAGVTAGALIDLSGWRAAFFVPGIVSLATGLALFVCLRLGLVEEGAARRAPPPASRSDMIRVFSILLMTMLAIGIIFQACQAAMPKVFDLRLRDLVGEGTFGIGALVAMVYLVGGVMQLAGGYLADRYALKPIYLISLLFQVPVLLGIGLLSGLPLVVLAAMTVLLSAGALPAENLLLNRYSPDKHRSLAFGVKYVIAFGSAPLALQLVSKMTALTGEFVWLFVALAAMAAVATLAAALLPGGWRKAPEAAPAPAE
ncbi:MAG: MFS transporter [Kiloniellales bacterium]|nr:MFS transporter [Kiloniellales bacterium]